MFVVHRGAATDTLHITPKAVTETDPATARSTTVGKIGAGAKNPVAPRRRSSLGEARSAGGADDRSPTPAAVFTVLHEIGNGQRSVTELGGPIAITRRVGDGGAERDSTSCSISLRCLSINVAVLNLLPIPILDGGQILINVLESAKGSPFSMRTREYILRFGLVAIALLVRDRDVQRHARGVREACSGGLGGCSAREVAGRVTALRAAPLHRVTASAYAS